MPSSTKNGNSCRRWGDIDVLKLGHHGSKVSVDAALLEILRPELSLASAGEGIDTVIRPMPASMP